MQLPTKQRLIGACAILLLVVIFLSLLFSKALTANLETSVVNASLDPAKTKEAVYDLPLTAAETSAAVPQKETTSEPELPRLAPPAPAAKKTHLTVDALPDAWVVQVASFFNTTNAERLANKLRSKGLLTYLRTSSRGGSTVTQVFVGPYIDEQTVEALRVRLKDDMKLDGIIKKYKA